MKVGEYLIQEKLITESQLKEALAIQNRNPDKKVGEILLELGFIDIEQFTRVLERQMKEAGLQK